MKDVTKEQRGGFLAMLLGKLGGSLLGNVIADTVAIQASDGVIRAGHDFSCCFIL